MLAGGIGPCEQYETASYAIDVMIIDVGCTTLEVHWRGLGWQEKSSSNQKQGRKRSHGHY
jgi:hypothetical protein